MARPKEPGGSEPLPLPPPGPPASVEPRIEDAEQRWQEVFIPVHGLIRLTAREIAVVDHPAFQRLGEIYQLGHTYLVYRGATHKRLEHALGTTHVAQLMIDALRRNCPQRVPRPEPGSAWSLDVALSDEETALVRLGALLHDLGHLPAGHTLEDELGVLPPHDGNQRMELILDRETWRNVRVGTTLRQVIDTQYKRVAEAVGTLTASELLLRIVSKDHKDEPSQTGTLRIGVLRDIIGNTICADLLDYLHRDWLHLGKRRELDTRLLEYLEIRTRTGTEKVSHLAINLRGGNRVRTDAATAILDLLESRYQLFEIALFHRTKLCAAAMLERMLAELQSALDDPEWTKRLPELLLDCSDAEMLGRFLTEISALSSVSAKNKVAVDAARELAQNLQLRRLHKEFVTAYEYDLANVTQSVQDLFIGPRHVDKKTERTRIGAQNRLTAMRHLEDDFGLKRGSLVMYCPPAKMSTKIAEVRILIHGDIHKLDEFEGHHQDRGITGGHLQAQKHRFRRLWRVLIAVEAATAATLRDRGMTQLLGRAIDLCILQRTPSTGTRQEAVLSLAAELTNNEYSPLFKGKVTGARVAARNKPHEYYPGDAPTLRSCVDVSAKP